MGSRGSHGMAAAALVAVLGLSLTACSGDSENGDGADDGPGATAGSSAPPSSAAPGGTPTSEDTSEDTSAVEPATGTLVEARGFTLRLPADSDWNVTAVGSAFGADTVADGQLVTIGGFGGPGQATDLDALAQDAAELAVGADSPPQRLADRTVSGADSYVLTWTKDDDVVQEFGGHHEGTDFSIQFVVPEAYADTETLVESVLASVEWD